MATTSIAKYMLANLATSYCLNRNDKVVAFIGLEGVNYVLSRFFFFSCYFHIIVFLLNCYFLISSCLSWLHRNPISHPISHTLGTPSWYVLHAPPYFWHRMRGFLKARRSREPSSKLTTGDFPPFRLSPKVSSANIYWTNANHTSLTKILELTLSCVT
jgi:hypothetical protein